MDADRGAADVPEAVREDRGGPPRRRGVTVAVQNRYNTYSFGGRKAVVLSTAGALGGKSSFLGRAYLAGGAACLGLALLLTLLGLLCPVPV